MGPGKGGPEIAGVGLCQFGLDLYPIPAEGILLLFGAPRKGLGPKPWSDDMNGLEQPLCPVLRNLWKLWAARVEHRSGVLAMAVSF